jgi:hypothetical protein
MIDETLEEDEEDTDRYMMVHPDMYAMLKEFEAHDRQWNRELFSPVGLGRLFPTLNRNR